MKSSRFSEEQIIGILKQAEIGVKVRDLCHQRSISDHTYYRWKAKFGGMEVSEAKRLKALEEENRQLKQLLSEKELDLLGLRTALSKKY
jgi:putative transposase